jgi:hypothetical protein
MGSVVPVSANWRASLRHPGHELQKLSGMNWLGRELIATRFEALLPNPLDGMCRQGHNRSVVPSLSQLPGDFESVH